LVTACATPRLIGVASRCCPSATATASACAQPRLRLIHGRRAPLVGGVAMDALIVDVTEIPEAQLADEAVLMGRQGEDEISVHDIARLKNSVRTMC